MKTWNLTKEAEKITKVWKCEIYCRISLTKASECKRFMKKRNRRLLYQHRIVQEQGDSQGNEKGGGGN